MNAAPPSSGPNTPPSDPPPPAHRTVAAWRAASLCRLLQFSARLRASMPVEARQLRRVLRTGWFHDRALRGTMAALQLNFDRVLIVVDAFITGGNSRPPPASRLQGEIVALVELGLMQIAPRASARRATSALTPRGQQCAAYMIYRLLVAATKDGAI